MTLDILDAIPFYILLIDRNHRILLANKATRQALRLEPHEILGDYCPRVVHGLGDGESYPGCPLEESVESQQMVERDHYDEQTGRWLRIGVYPTDAVTPDGEKIYLHALQDISDQKKAEEDLRRSEEKHRELLKELTRQR